MNGWLEYSQGSYTKKNTVKSAWKKGVNKSIYIHHPSCCNCCCSHCDHHHYHPLYQTLCLTNAPIGMVMLLLLIIIIILGWFSWIVDTTTPSCELHCAANYGIELIILFEILVNHGHVHVCLTTPYTIIESCHIFKFLPIELFIVFGRAIVLHFTVETISIVIIPVEPSATASSTYWGLLVKKYLIINIKYTTAQDSASTPWALRWPYLDYLFHWSYRCH